MGKILFILPCIIIVLMQSCIQNERTKQDRVLNGYGAEIEEVFFDGPYYIRENEVRDTSFTLPRKQLDDPMAFMKALTNVQMINRNWRDRYDYTEKLLFGDSILGKICREVADGKGTPVFLTDDICDEENFSYLLSVRIEGDLSYTSYSLTEHGIRETSYKISEYYRGLLDEWNKKEMFLVGETDEEKRIVTSTGRIICIGDVIGRNSGCITRLRCDKDSVYVDMVKLYLWTLEYILDEAEENERMNRYLMKKKEKQLEQNRLNH